MIQAVTPKHFRQRLEAYVGNYPESTGEQNIWRTHTEIDTFKDFEDTTEVCGKCQVLLPCSLRVPGGKK